MSRRVLTAVELLLVTGALAAAVWILAAAAHRPGIPSAAQAAAVATITLLTLAAPSAACVLWLEARHTAQRRRLRKSLLILHGPGRGRHRSRA